MIVNYSFASLRCQSSPSFPIRFSSLRCLSLEPGRPLWIVTATGGRELNVAKPWCFGLHKESCPAFKSSLMISCEEALYKVAHSVPFSAIFFFFEQGKGGDWNGYPSRKSHSVHVMDEYRPWLWVWLRTGQRVCLWETLHPLCLTIYSPALLQKLNRSACLWQSLKFQVCFTPQKSPGARLAGGLLLTDAPKAKQQLCLPTYSVCPEAGGGWSPSTVTGSHRSL